MQKKCIYCGKQKPEEEFSLEHIFPDALGGALCDMRFKSHNVCQRCNSLCGIWVDAPVIKNWFSQNYNFDLAREFIDLEKGSMLPLIYIGIFSELCSNEKDCELWLGPCGDKIYHFRNKNDGRYDSIVGGDFINIKKNPGTAYLFIATDNMDWTKTVLFSFREHFKYSKRIAGNLSVDGDLSNKDFFETPSDEEKQMIEILKQYKEQLHKAQFSTELGFEQRFLCKIALGVGYNLFGESYLENSYALELRKGLWEKDPQKRSQLKIIGTNFRYDENTFKELLCYKSAHLISLLDVGEYLSLGFCLYGKIFTQIAISDEKHLWDSYKEFSDGIVYLIFPQINEIIGPIDLPSYLAHKTEKDFKIKELEELEKRRRPLKELPPFKSAKFK